MRKNDVRKWIHAGLDLLPLLIIPIFALAVRSDNNFSPIEVQIEEDLVVDFNQLIIPRSVSGNGVTVTYDNSSGNMTIDGSLIDNNVSYLNVTSQPVSFISGHKYYLRDFTNLLSGNNYGLVQFHVPIAGVGNYLTNQIVTSSVTTYSSCYFELRYGASFNDVSFYLNLYDLTQMFGVGNEPTIEEFNTYFPNVYSPYTISEKLLIHYNSVTYNDTDVGSQMVYTLYNATNKYFNFNNVFNFNQIYDWLEVNIFHGTAPMSIFIAWNIFLYEFLMDLIFLLYALFMFFVDFCSNLIDRFHTKCSGGK